MIVARGGDGGGECGAPPRQVPRAVGMSAAAADIRQDFAELRALMNHPAG